MRRIIAEGTEKQGRNDEGKTGRTLVRSRSSPFDDSRWRSRIVAPVFNTFSSVIHGFDNAMHSRTELLGEKKKKKRKKEKKRKERKKDEKKKKIGAEYKGVRF